MSDRLSNTYRRALSEAVARRAGLVLALPAESGFSHHKSRFLGEGKEGVWVKAPSRMPSGAEQLLGAGSPVGIAFRSDGDKWVFLTPLRGKDVAAAIDPMEFESLGFNAFTALLLQFPTEMRRVQRRNSHRVKLTEDSGVTLRVWKLARDARITDRPMAHFELRAEPHDISAGGMGLTLYGREGGAPKLMAHERLRVELTYNLTTLLMEGRLREAAAPAPGISPEPTAGLRTGIHFRAMQNDLKGRQKLAQLNKLVNTIQREQVRRKRITG